MQHELLIIDGPESGRSFSVSEDQPLVVGRGRDSNTQIGDPRMSRVHCRFTVQGPHVTVKDAGSSSGTMVDGRAIREHTLRPGEVVEAGDTKIRYVASGVEEDQTLVGARPAPVQTAPKALSELVGQSFGSYRLDGIISKGHTSIVFQALDTEKKRPVAVKVLFPEYAASDEQKQRFVRAMKTMLPVRHENIVSLYGAGKQGPYCWAAMELVDGESLDKVIGRIGTAGMLDWKETFRVALHCCRGLQAALEHKVIHRNLTPTSLLRRSSDKVTKLADLMLAKATEGALARQVTSPGQLIGDVPFMSPERTRQDVEVDCRSDIYELGATLYALLTGRPPFEGDTLPQLIKRIREDEPEPPKKFHLAVPDQFQDVVMQMLEKRPADRYETPNRLLVELTRAGKFQGINAEEF